MSDHELLTVTGAREHNLKGVTVSLPKNRLVVFTGVSGSGKSSLAFDTLYAEGQRRYVESLSAYARQFLGRMERPRYDTIRGLSPTIAIEQRTSSANPRSTVATITEIADYLRVLYARTGILHCPRCGLAVDRQSAQQVVKRLLALPTGTRLTLLAPVVSGRKGEHQDLLDDAQRTGFTRVRIDGAVHRLDERPAIDPKTKHDIEIIVDRIVLKDGIDGRLTDSVETALRAGGGTMLAAPDGAEEQLLSEKHACAPCGLSLPELSPQLFSWNAPHGMCLGCQGLGSKLDADPDRLVPDPSKSLKEGAIALFAGPAGGMMYRTVLEALIDQFSIDPTIPYRKIPAAKRKILMEGAGNREVKVRWESERMDAMWTTRWHGLVKLVERKVKDTTSEAMRRFYMSFFSSAHCTECDGARLNETARAVRVGGKTLPQLLQASVGDTARFFDELELDGARGEVASELVREVRNRLRFLVDVGLPYLSLDRSGPTLSGGEAQRIRLASQVGTELSGVLYVLDEPSVGLHPRDTQRLLRTLERLRDLDNTVLVVEHDADTINAADYIVDFGPGAGVHGGRVMATGTPAEVAAAKDSLTGAFLSGRERIEIPRQRRQPTATLTLYKASLNNLADVDASFPLGCLVAVAGVSGAGKSSLVTGTLEPLLARELNGADRKPGPYGAIEGLAHLDKVVSINQRPIGLTPRSNPATYVKAFDEIREVFAALPESKAFGFKPSRFSFNVKGGRCEACQGDGLRKVEMHFLPDVYVKCEVCDGKRFNDATLRVRFKGKTIADVLHLTVSEAIQLLANQKRALRPLQTLEDVGLGYLELGQPSTTLSGGEAQRVKLSRELARMDTGRTMYVLDEPTTGLHFDDVRRLLAVLNRLVDAGNTVLVIEHNLEVLKCADHVIDVGPEGGDGGGRVLVQGTPEEVAATPGSHTGQHLATVLRQGRGR